MEEFSANGKCVVCGKGFAARKKTTGIDRKTPVILRIHPWCYCAMQEGKKKPIAFWRSVGWAK